MFTKEVRGNFHNFKYSNKSLRSAQYILYTVGLLQVSFTEFLVISAVN